MQVGDLARELAAAKQRTTKLESELTAVKRRAEGLEKDVEHMRGRPAAGKGGAVQLTLA